MNEVHPRYVTKAFCLPMFINNVTSLVTRCFVIFEQDSKELMHEWRKNWQQSLVEKHFPCDRLHNDYKS